MYISLKRGSLQPCNSTEFPPSHSFSGQARNPAYTQHHIPLSRPKAFTHQLECNRISVASTCHRGRIKCTEVWYYLEKGHMPSSSKCVVRDKEYHILLLLPFSTGHGTKPLGATELACWGIFPTIFTLQQVCLLVKL